MKDKAAAASVLQPQRAAEKGRGAGAVVVVAVRAAAREISKTAVVWALTHVVQHGDSILLLVVIPPPSSGRKFWGFPLFARDCASGHKAVLNQMSDVDELCSQMMLNLRDVYDPNKINVKIKILSGSPSGTVANESKRAQASWVVLDKELKHEEKHCLEELQCNIVVMKRAWPKVLRLNLVGSPEKVSNSTPHLPPEPNTNSSLTKEATKDNIQHSDVNISDSESEVSTPPAASALQPWMADILQRPATTRLLGNRPRRTPTADSLLEKIAKLDLLTEINAIRSRSDLNFRGNVRDAVSLSRRAPPGPPPLCSICQHKTPVFGKPPRWFSYAELELATGGFSQANFLAEGGFGSVHRGVLPDGQAIAVKQHKLASSQGDVEFCSEVEVGDFGLARWQPDGDMGVETRVIGTFGYLAPEYAQSGQITEKADVYSFGVVLVELVTGRKAVDINRPKGQQFLTEWARPLLEEYAIDELIDPRLGRRFCENEVYCMLHAANLCIRRDPHLRPRMSHVLRILEGGDMVVDSGSDAGSRSWRMLNENQRYQEQSSPAQHDSQRALETARSPWGQDRHNLSHRY
nr:unnamed protein product [Digitaria exilis]